MARHAIPFIIAVRDHAKPAILRAFERRLGHDTAAERAEALHQVERIALHRLKALLP
jgi:chitin deacetylase